MAVHTFRTLEEVALESQIAIRFEPFVSPVARPVDPRFRDRLAFLRKHAPVNVSEEAVCEFFIAPILQELWIDYSDALTIWSHVALAADENLHGFPDYFFAKRSPLGPVRDKPFVIFVEAKRDDFDAGWAQCLGAMLAGQRLNRPSEQSVHGGVSNGPVWYFGRLDGSILTQDSRAFTVDDLDGLFASLNYVLGEARKQAAT